MDRIPSAAKPARPQVGLIAHRQHQRTHRLPARCREAALDTTDRGLRGAGTARERALTQAELLTMSPNQVSGSHDI